MPSRVVTCNITYLDVARVACEGRTFEDSARRLGVSASYLWKRLKAMGALHWFQGNSHPRGFPSRISDEDIISVAGMIKKDAAVVLGISCQHFHHLVKVRKLQHHFPSMSEAVSLAHTGYTR